MAARKIPCGIAFHASWWHKQIGLLYDREHYTDPDYQVDAEQRRHRYLHERFGDLGLGAKDSAPQPILFGYGIATLPALFGSRIVFLPDDEPYALPRNLSDEEVRALTVPCDLAGRYPLNEIIANGRHLLRRFGRVVVAVNWQGVQNLALKMRGETLFADYYENPDLAHRVLDVAARTIVAVVRLLESEFGSFPPTTVFTTSNCTVDVVTADIYERFLLPYDTFLARAFGAFGIHHCGRADRFLPGYARVENLRFFEAGWGSDIALVRQRFPSIPVNARIGPVRLQNVDPGTVERDVQALIRDGEPLDTFSISAVGVDTGTPDENIRAMFRAATAG